jgi:putative lipoprotein
MKRIALMLFMILIPAAWASAEGDSFFGEDKAKHFLVSACMAGMLTYALSIHSELKAGQPLRMSCSITLGLGILKEVWDARRKDNHFCFKDLLWDAAGVSAGVLNIRTLPAR